MAVHNPVMVTETLAGLNVQPDGIYIDATFGRGGHSRAILHQLSERGRLIAIDRDPSAVGFAQQAFAEDARFSIVAAGFSQLSEIAKRYDIDARVNGILLDLGVSSPQLDQAERGFSFSKVGPLDMRMDPSQGHSAAQWLQSARVEEIVTVLRDYGEERFAKRIAAAIVAHREREPLVTTEQLAILVGNAKPKWEKKIHPATKTFQAIRMFINEEQQELQAVLAQSLAVLATGGRLAVISFHSLEDRLVKRFMRVNSRDNLPAKLPVKTAEVCVPLRIVDKVQQASLAEQAQNPRSRSAILRIGEKLV
jgi:16S rRNA (cytosine1402-N4)-methyltransferase